MQKLIIKSILSLFLAIVLSDAQQSFSAETIFSLGTRDHSDTEFQQTNFNLNFDVETQTTSEFPKELNTSWYPHQYLRVTLPDDKVNSELLLILIPAYSDGSGILNIALDVWNGSQWIEAGKTLCNMHNPGYVEIPSGFLTAGANEWRLRAISGNGATTVITWDQILCVTRDENIIAKLGINDGSESEFSHSNFILNYYPDRNGVQEFPDEINTTWYPTQYFHLELSESQYRRPLTWSFDAAWQDSSGTLQITLEFWDGTHWKYIDRVGVRARASGTIEIPVDALLEGENHFRITALPGTGNCQVIKWDQIRIYNIELPPKPIIDLLEEVLDTSLNYFLSTDVFHPSGLPLTALKTTDRARYAYSNPTEWGFAMQAWILAAQRGLITKGVAVNRIAQSLLTLDRLQRNSNEFIFGMFYPYYSLTNAMGTYLRMPTRDMTNTQMPSGDNALLIGSLFVVEGWLKEVGATREHRIASSVRRRINISMCFFQDMWGSYIAHFLDTQTGQLSPYTWYFYADEGGAIAHMAYVSGSLTWRQFTSVIDRQYRLGASWKEIHVNEAPFFNAMFPWGQRPIIGIPIQDDSSSLQYALYSFAPSVRAHLKYADYLGINYPGFSDAMTQTWGGSPLVGRKTPPNVLSEAPLDPPSHITPHALFIPFCIADSLDRKTLNKLYEKIVLLKSDTNGYWHPIYSADPYGFEVVASPYLNDSSYIGADEGRYIFETLSQAYTVFSIYHGLARWQGLSTFYDYSKKNLVYQTRMRKSYSYAYP